MSTGSHIPDKDDAVSMHSINIDASPVSSVNQPAGEMQAPKHEALDSPEQLAAPSDGDTQQVQQSAISDSRSDHSEAAEELRDADDTSDGTEESEMAGTEMTQDENLTRTMQMLYGEMGSTILTSLPGVALFDVIRSIAKLVGGGGGGVETQGDEEWSATMELLNCSSAGNLMQRLEAWPTCNRRLITCAASSDFQPLFADTMHELSERNGGDERRAVTGEYKLGPCDVCCSAADTLLWTRGCCATSVCVVCLHRWLIGRLSEIQTELACPGCSTVLTVSEVRHLLSDEAVARRENLLARHRDDNGERDCPRCSCMAQRPVREKRRRFRRSNKAEREQGGVLVKCRQCDYLWCFDCHSPIHPGLTCRRHRSGAQQLESWAKTVEESGLRKARRCTRCKVMIEKNEGCNHMTCANCHHEFCYQCSKRWHVREVRVPYFGWSIFGSHSSRLSVFGCSQNFMPDRTGLRRFIRGILFVLRVCGLVLIPTVGVAILLPIALALVAIAIPLAPIVIPAVLLYIKLRRKQRA